MITKLKELQCAEKVIVELINPENGASVYGEFKWQEVRNETLETLIGYCVANVIKEKGVAEGVYERGLRFGFAIKFEVADKKENRITTVEGDM